MLIYIDSALALTELECASLPILNLAYVGDSVFDLYVRTFMVLNKKEKTGALHSYSSEIVNARAQCGFANKIYGLLTEKEENVFTRGRNAKTTNIPKNMTLREYKYATAAEAVIGYLYLTGNTQRLNELLQLIEFEDA